MKSSPPPKLPWPPIIDSGHVPLGIRLRDVILTALAWLILIALLWQFIDLLWDYFSYPFFTFSRTHSVAWSLLWDRIEIFAVLSGILVVWLVFVGVARYQDLSRNKDFRIVPPLPLSDHAASFGISESTVQDWRRHRVVVVRFGAADRIESVTAKTTDLPKESG